MKLIVALETSLGVSLGLFLNNTSEIIPSVTHMWTGISTAELTRPKITDNNKLSNKNFSHFPSFSKSAIVNVTRSLFRSTSNIAGQVGRDAIANDRRLESQAAEGRGQVQVLVPRKPCVVKCKH